MLERIFHVRELGSTPAREALGGFTTFLTMSYIVVVNPIFLTAAGMPFEGAVAATCVSAGLATLLMAFLANYPIALAPGMGLNAFFAYNLCLGAKVPWQTALGIVFWSGALFVLLTASGLRAILVRAIPRAVTAGAAVGIGLFIAFIGLEQGGLVKADPNTLVTLGDLHATSALIALFGLALALGLAAAGWSTALFWGTLAALGASLWAGTTVVPDAWVSWPAFEFPGLQIDLWGALRVEYLPLILVNLFLAFFDTLGTLLAVAHEAGLVRNGKLPRLERALAADALGMVSGALLGTSTVTSYVESGAGVGVGARTGLASVVTGSLLLGSLFLVPLLTGLAAGGGLEAVTTPALVLVGILMVRTVREIDWEDLTEAAPAFLTALLMPLTFNIAHGLAAGIVGYVLVKVAARRGKEVHPLLAALAALVVLRYALLPG